MTTETCDYCKTSLDAHKFDCRTPPGRWGYFCESCFRTLDLHLGVGRGQEYIRAPRGTWQQVQGGSMKGKEF